MGHIWKLFRHFAQIRHLNNFENLSLQYWLLFILKSFEIFEYFKSFEIFESNTLSQFLIKLIFYDSKGERLRQYEASYPSANSQSPACIVVTTGVWNETGWQQPGEEHAVGYQWHGTKQDFPLCIPVVLGSEGNCCATLTIFYSSLTLISKLVKNLRDFKMIWKTSNIWLNEVMGFACSGLLELWPSARPGICI